MKLGASLAISIAISAALGILVWLLTGQIFLFFALLAPVGLLFGRSRAGPLEPPTPTLGGVCPECGHVGEPGDRYCPLDASPLRPREP